MSRLNSTAARDIAHQLHPYTNAVRHAEVGPIVIDKGEGIYVIDDEVGLEASCLYVLENPVRAGLCEKPSDWHWSGCPALEAP